MCSNIVRYSYTSVAIRLESCMVYSQVRGSRFAMRCAPPHHYHSTTATGALRVLTQFAATAVALWSVVTCSDVLDALGILGPLRLQCLPPLTSLMRTGSSALRNLWCCAPGRRYSWFLEAPRRSMIGCIDVFNPPGAKLTYSNEIKVKIGRAPAPPHSCGPAGPSTYSPQNTR